ncbi:CRIB domain-containing protein [Vigna angularis]|uniref:CRIB domain-containing protein n=1 Tax=Phaseolus angularis TaxID=3914 RepID=A0A8T0L4N9_PHAAN|nr:CRIB domain-containing protein RIC7 [Vigna angularis]KAG2405918.1 CRIB domain-containing protein [Vigna angularis]
MSNNNKVKGLLKGLRFISQMFDEKDSDIQIGHPTDVKHLAHIGWDGQGPSDNNPTWMNEFKSVPGNSSASHSRKGDIDHSKESNSSIQRASEDEEFSFADSMERSSRSVKGDERHSFESAKSKQHSNSTGNVRESQAKEKSDRPRRSKKSSKSSHQPHDSCQTSKDTDHDMHTGDISHQHEDSDLAPRKSRPKMSKEGSNVGGASSRGRSKCEGHGRRSSKLANKHESLQEDGHVETTKSTEDTGKSNLNGH